jgi:hypothetical protein
MTQQGGKGSGDNIGGVSLPSFLQMLEQERKSCTLVVRSGEQQGKFYFNGGILVDAKFGAEVGEDAAYGILMLESPMFSVVPPEDRMRRIYLPLAHILLDSAKQSDETGGEEYSRPPGETEEDDEGDPFFEPVHPDPAVRHVIRTVTSIAGIRHYVLLNRQGRLITQSSRQMKIADFIAYCIVSGIQMRKALDIKGPSRIQLVLDSGETILVMPGSGMIIGLLLDEFASISDITETMIQAGAGR